MNRNTVRTFDSHNPTNWRYYDIAQKPRQHSERIDSRTTFRDLLALRDAGFHIEIMGGRRVATYRVKAPPSWWLAWITALVATMMRNVRTR